MGKENQIRLLQSDLKNVISDKEEFLLKKDQLERELGNLTLTIKELERKEENLKEQIERLDGTLLNRFHTTIRGIQEHVPKEEWQVFVWELVDYVAYGRLRKEFQLQFPAYSKLIMYDDFPVAEVKSVLIYDDSIQHQVLQTKRRILACLAI